MESKLHCFESAIRLYQEKPWDLFDAHEVFELDKSYYAKHVYGLFCYKGGKKCIRIFHGIESFSDLSDYFKPMGYPQIDIFHSFEHEFIEVIFDDPEHLSDEDMQTGEAMGLSAREIPVLRIHRRRHYTSGLSDDELAMLQSILDSLHEAMNAYLKSGLEINFDKCRFVFDIKNKSCFSKKTAYRPRKYDIVEIDDEELISQLQLLDEIDEVWEFDLQVSDSLVFASEGDLSSPVYLAALANVLDQQILAAVPFDPNGDFQFQCIDLMVEAFMQRGLPKALVVRHPLVGAAMMDLTRRLKINLMPVEEFEMLDDFVSGLDLFMNQNNEMN